MRNKMFLLLIFLILLLPINVKAEQCSSEFRQSLLKLANTIDIKYNYIENYESTSEIDPDKNNRFKFIISNLPKEIIIVDNLMHQQFINDTDSEIANKESIPVIGGASYKFVFYYSGDSCDQYLIKSQTIDLPIYNEYWNDNVCNGAENYIYCQKLIPNKISYESLSKRVEEYKNKNTVNNDEINNDSNDENSYFKYVIISIPIVIVVLVIILFIVKKKKRRINI